MISTIALPTAAASANFPTALNCADVDMPKPTAIGRSVYLRRRPPTAAHLRASAAGSRSLRCAKPRTQIRRRLGNLLQSRIGAGGSGQECRRQRSFLHLVQIVARFFHRQVGDQSAVNAGVLGRSAESCHPHTQDRVQIGKNDKPRLRALADFFGQFQAPAAGKSRGEVLARWRAGSQVRPPPDR